LKIEWFDSALNDIPDEKQTKKIQDWIDKNEDEIHELFHIAQEYEIEAIKIIDGKQSQSGEKVNILSYDLYVLPNIILIAHSNEVQNPDKNESSRSLRFIGEVEIPCDEEQEVD
jgi:hypothetical protein